MNTNTTDRIEYETEQSRVRVAALLDEMRARLSLGEMVDQAVDYVGTGSGREMLNRLGGQVRGNPLSCLMIGGGVAWLLLSDSRRRSRGANGAEQPQVHSGQYAASVSGAAQQVGETVSRASEAISDTYQRARQGVSQTFNTAGDAAASFFGQSATDTARQTAAKAASGVDYLVHQQPLVLAGIGLAAGAALGAALPSTDVENRVMGAASDELKDRARETATEAKEVATQTIEVADDASSAPSVDSRSL